MSEHKHLQPLVDAQPTSYSTGVASAQIHRRNAGSRTT